MGRSNTSVRSHVKQEPLSVPSLTRLVTSAESHLGSNLHTKPVKTLMAK